MNQRSRIRVRAGFAALAVGVFLAATGPLFGQEATSGGAFLYGADLSTLGRSLAFGARYYDEQGKPTDPLAILEAHGVSFVRLRAWVAPANGANGTEEVVQFAKRVHQAGLRLLIDLHYSDTWADPSHQTKPAAWAHDSFDELLSQVYTYTAGVCAALKEQGIEPDIVQTGNEINAGMLWPDGGTNDWPKLAMLLKRAYAAVKDSLPETQVMLHLANAGDEAGAQGWFDNARSLGVQWDIIGLSYYSYWHGPMSAMTETLRVLHQRYGKPVIIVETAYPFTLSNADNERNVIFFPGQLTAGYPATPEGQERNLEDVVAAAKAGGAAGLFYWEPTWTAVAGNGWDPTDPSSGDGWENQALFDFAGRALPGLAAFGK